MDACAFNRSFVEMIERDVHFVSFLQELSQKRSPVETGDMIACL